LLDEAFRVYYRGNPVLIMK